MAQAPETTTTGIAADLLGAARTETISDLGALESMYGEPKRTSIDKVTPVLTPLMIAFLQASPMYFMATASAKGICDATPRGDPAGAVAVADERTLILPDRRGNKRVDSIRNLVENPSVGLVFLVPGIEDTLRVNGRVTLSRHQPLLDALAMRGNASELALIVDIDEAYMHCPRAFKRSKLWDPETWPAEGEVPTMAAILHQMFQPEESLEAFAEEREQRARRELY
ncbi:MAG: pyridoxamine 5'-phosphate oxidase family protein [Chloroflexota bacterium]|nr:pyridoxamine 5'-phosphate oxidase family protein [Chloroflexota bacterium]